MTLAVTQRFGSSLNPNVHFHAIVSDGVYVAKPDGTILFRSFRMIVYTGVEHADSPR